MAQEMLINHLDDVTTHMYKDTYQIRDVEDICQYLTSFPPGINSSDEAKLELRNAVAQHLAERGGVLEVKRIAGLVCGRK